MALRNKELILKKLEQIEDKFTVLDTCVKMNDSHEKFFKTTEKGKALVQEILAYIDNEQ
tara:strand:+ start:198 stop:374 length:177 start_codon:yes stop_codon:yes gene_type:complete